jgi:hypothetical protein
MLKLRIGDFHSSKSTSHTVDGGGFFERFTNDYCTEALTLQSY